MFSPEELTPVYREMFRQIAAGLPAEIAEKFRASRSAFVHQQKTDMVLFNVWGKSQIGLERNQFNYCLNHKPLRPEPDGRKWLLQLRCNIERIRLTYPEVRDRVRHELRRLQGVCPKPFEYRENTQTVELRYTFDFIKPPSEFNRFIVPHFLALIAATHEIYADAVELFHENVSRRVVVTGVNTQPKPTRRTNKDLLVYSRSLSGKMKAEILERHKGCCAHCGKPVVEGDVEFHHVKPVSKGGLRILENFQPLHVSCHDEVHRRMAD